MWLIKLGFMAFINLRLDLFWHKKEAAASTVCLTGWLTVVCETKWDETKWNETKWNETKWDETKWKSVVCEMKICSLRNENL